MTVSPTPTAEKVVAEWRAAMEGVPAGKWQMKDFDVELSIATMDGSAPLIADLVEQGDSQEPGYWGSEYQIGQWLARCSPSGISALLALIESQRATIERVERERDEARASAKNNRDGRLALKARVTALEAEKAKAVADEREACAQVADSFSDACYREARLTTKRGMSELHDAAASECEDVAAAIRVRTALSLSSTEVKNDG